MLTAQPDDDWRTVTAAAAARSHHNHGFTMTAKATATKAKDPNNTASWTQARGAQPPRRDVVPREVLAARPERLTNTWGPVATARRI